MYIHNLNWHDENVFDECVKVTDCDVTMSWFIRCLKKRLKCYKNIITHCTCIATHNFDHHHHPFFVRICSKFIVTNINYRIISYTAMNMKNHEASSVGVNFVSFISILSF